MGPLFSRLPTSGVYKGARTEAALGIPCYGIVKVQFESTLDMDKTKKLAFCKGAFHFH